MSTCSYQQYDELLGKLQTLGTHKKLPTLRRFAVLHLNDKEKLFRIAQDDPDKSIRYLAVKKLDNEEQLFEIAQSDPDLQVQKVAVQRIYNPKRLALLRLSTNSDLQPYIREQAQISATRGLLDS